ncbi:hypothetical protein A3A56_03535 [Candidatus Roizmanbacteria bacterium RIFCSPLOWO2_01_FULL_40_32]|nr:MAG: hypothetical protein A3A56_03535 [Candidatus Roizmanbacteria bacterium RIFCSPLOWO2_01_FULL_40_32]
MQVKIRGQKQVLYKCPGCPDKFIIGEGRTVRHAVADLEREKRVHARECEGMEHVHVQNTHGKQSDGNQPNGKHARERTIRYQGHRNGR